MSNQALKTFAALSDIVTNPETARLPTNRHPADRLAAVRAEIKRLQAVEEECRNQLLSNPDDLEGDEYEADIREKTYEKIDTKSLKKIHPDIVSQFITTSVMKAVWLKARSEPDENGD